ncbi:MAG: type IV pilus twitching motility protein PilT [Armatimonadota bacterium]
MLETIGAQEDRVEAPPEPTLDVMQLLQCCVKERASDLHLTEGEPPILRVNSSLQRMRLPACTKAQLQVLIYQLLSNEQQVKFERELELDFAITLPNLGRFRANVHRQRGAIEAAFRCLPTKIPSLSELGLPPIAGELAGSASGLVLVTGPTGMGKSTTLASLVDQIITTQDLLVISIEDPIEYLHENKRGVVKQRELHADTHSFAEALRRVLRQDPDVIVIGEMRDLETIAIALTAAETGHLVLATIHTPDGPQSIERMIDVFPPYQQRQVQLQLANCLQGVISQVLLPRLDGSGMALAAEVMIATPGVRNLIREHAIEQLPTMMQTGARFGMTTMDKSIAELFKHRQISRETALMKMKHPEDIDKL